MGKSITPISQYFYHLTDIVAKMTIKIFSIRCFMGLFFMPAKEGIIFFIYSNLYFFISGDTVPVAVVRAELLPIGVTETRQLQPGQLDTHTGYG